ncbi:Crp/Fnr family transcriptional regulator [Geodermatophilus sp. CPCC 206100]|uniref:Crp/Fnr family transcriptional regulator n=1 Tax=Geodermatophilus sp. CPCC 206100 TaxID=3020054 RepID=UPI003AFF895D
MDGAWAESVFGTLHPAVQARLRQGATAASVPAGQVIYRGGGAPRLALVVSGLARVLISSPDGRRATVRYARRGDFTGIISVIADRQVVDSEAVTGCDVLFLEVDAVTRVARNDAGVAWLLAREAGQVCSEVIEMSATNVFGTIRRRVAWHLLDLAQQDEEGLVVVADQQEMADSIGSVREVVARALRGLREDGLVGRSQQGVRLLDPAALHAVAVGER